MALKKGYGHVFGPQNKLTHSKHKKEKQKIEVYHFHLLVEYIMDFFLFSITFQIKCLQSENTFLM